MYHLDFWDRESVDFSQHSILCYSYCDHFSTGLVFLYLDHCNNLLTGMPISAVLCSPSKHIYVHYCVVNCINHVLGGFFHILKTGLVLHPMETAYYLKSRQPWTGILSASLIKPKQVPAKL